MLDFRDLGRGVYSLDAGYLRPQMAAIYLVVDGGEAAFIETGTTHSMPAVRDALAAVDLTLEQVRYVIPTHVHLDHAGGAGAMMALFPNAELIIHPRGARHMIDPSRLIAATQAVYGEALFAELYGDVVPVDETRVVVAEDGHRAELGGRTFEFIDTPGHARHHFCVVDAASTGIFSGDTGGISYDPVKTLPRGLLPTTTPTQFDPDALKASFGRLLSYQPERFYLTHYSAFENPAEHASSFADWIDEFIAICERTDPLDDASEAELEAALRDAVLTALGSGPADFDAIMAADIRLNAQGLAHWWRSRSDG